MNIAFWGEERQSGTTTHMHAVVEVMSVLCPQEKLMLGGTLHGGDGEIHFYDCGSGLNERKRHVLWNADLTVVSLPREKRCVERFFMQDFHVSRNLLFLLGGCMRGNGVDRRYLEYVYRVQPEYIAELPFCNGFYHALQREEGRAYLRRELQMPGSRESEQLVRELAHVTRMIERLARETEAEQAVRRAEEEAERARQKRRRRKKL